MWAIDNRTPFKVERAWGRDRHGAHEWLIAVKGTFRIGADGNLTVADEQLDALLHPEHHGAPGASSLRYDADVVAQKPTTDIVLNATAYAPGGRPSGDFHVGMAVGPVRKTLRVRGHRGRKNGLFDALATPVSSLPIVYERAFGGCDDSAQDARRWRIDPRNPVGVGVGTNGSPADRLAPNFEYPSGTLAKAGPAGFGAIDSHWSPRLEHHGTYDDAWSETRRPLLPHDWDPRSLQSAPPDQQAPHILAGGERVELVNLTPAGRLGFALPRVALRFRTLLDGRYLEHAGRLSSVIIEPDAARLILVWQTALRVTTNGDYLEHTVVTEKVRLN